MRRWVVVAAVLVALAGCDSLPGRPTEGDKPVPPPEVKDFTKLYDMSCAGCHGSDGTGGAAQPLNDPLYLALVRDDTLRNVIRHGMPETMMPPFAESDGGRLTEAQVDILVNGMRKRWASPNAVANVSLPPYSAEDAAKAGTAPGNPQRGGEVYARYCQRCHGTEENPGKDGSVTDGDYLALVSDQALRTAVIVGRPDLDAPDWRNNIEGHPVSNQEISDVVAWLAAHRHRLAAQSPPSSAPRAGEATPSGETNG